MLRRPWWLILLLLAPAAGDPASAPLLEPGRDLAILEEAEWARFERDGHSVAVHLSVPSGAAVLADDVLHVSGTAFEVRVDEPWHGELRPERFVLRFWTGSIPPASDADAQVCAVVDLVADQAEGTCAGKARMQVELALPPDASGAGRAAWRLVPADGPAN